MKLDSIVREYLLETGENTEHKYVRFLQYGISGLREFHMDSTGIPKIERMKVNDNMTVDLPQDYLSFIKLAVCDLDGNLHYLGHNPEMCPLAFDDCGNQERSEPDNENGGFGFYYDYEQGHYRNNESVGRYFGIGGGTNRNGYYKLYEKEGYLALQGFQGSEIYLEYLADLERNSSGEYEVHPYIVEPLKAWMQWKSIQRNPRRGLGDAQLAYKDFLVEKNKAERRLAAFTPEQFLQSVRTNFTLAPRF
jgi:hypothetical protein